MVSTHVLHLLPYAERDLPTHNGEELSATANPSTAPHLKLTTCAPYILRAAEMHQRHGVWCFSSNSTSLLVTRVPVNRPASFEALARLQIDLQRREIPQALYLLKGACAKPQMGLEEDFLPLRGSPITKLALGTRDSTDSVSNSHMSTENEPLFAYLLQIMLSGRAFRCRFSTNRLSIFFHSAFMHSTLAALLGKNFVGKPLTGRIVPLSGP